VAGFSFLVCGAQEATHVRQIRLERIWTARSAGPGARSAEGRAPGMGRAILVSQPNEKTRPRGGFFLACGTGAKAAAKQSRAHTCGRGPSRPYISRSPISTTSAARCANRPTVTMPGI